MFSWMRDKDSSAPVQVDVMKLLSRSEYMADDEAARQAVQQREAAGNPLMKQLESCADIHAHMVKCIEENPSSDPKCLLLHQAWLICAGRQVAPALHDAFVQCATRHRAKPELCEGEFQSMWNGAANKAATEWRKRAFTDVEEEAMLDCKVFKEQLDKAIGEHGGDSPHADQSFGRWMQCVFPRACETDWRAYERCLASNKGSMDECIEEGESDHCALSGNRVFLTWEPLLRSPSGALCGRLYRALSSKHTMKEPNELIRRRNLRKLDKPC